MRVLRGENLEVSAYFFCLDAKKVTKKIKAARKWLKMEGCHLHKKELAGRVSVIDRRAGSDSFFAPSRLRRSHGASLPFS
jgi:hypothetical protein